MPHDTQLTTYQLTRIATRHTSALPREAEVMAQELLQSRAGVMGPAVANVIARMPEIGETDMDGMTLVAISRAVERRLTEAPEDLAEPPDDVVYVFPETVFDAPAVLHFQVERGFFVLATAHAPVERLHKVVDAVNEKLAAITV